MHEIINIITILLLVGAACYYYSEQKRLGEDNVELLESLIESKKTHSEFILAVFEDIEIAEDEEHVKEYIMAHKENLEYLKDLEDQMKQLKKEDK